MSRRAAVLACLASLALARAPPANAYSSLAGSCDHAGVVHGMDRIAPQPGTGGYTLRLGHPGVNVPGATVPVALSGDEPHKGFLVYAVLGGDEASSKEMYVGSWDDAAMPDGAQTHPHCAHAATHDAFHNAGIVTDLLPFIVPENLEKGARVTFKTTVVRDYETWFAFETSFVVGAADGAGDADVAFPSTTTSERATDTNEETNEETRAPGEERQTKPKTKTRAPSLGKAVEGGWRAPSRKSPRTKAPASVGGERGAVAAGDADGASLSSSSAYVGGRKAKAGASVGSKRRAAAGTTGSTATKKKTDDAPSSGTAPADPLADPNVARTRRRNARLAHGFAMAVAWLFFAPSGVLVARHGKASKTWFSTHRASGMAVAALTLLSAWYIISVRGWSTPWGKHGKTGGAVLFLVSVQAVGGHYRKRFPRSKWSKWHRIFGGVSLTLGAYNCLAGAAMVGWMEVGYGNVLTAARVAVVTWIAVALALEVKRRNAAVARKRGRTA